jgi:hypothetical protein
MEVTELSGMPGEPPYAVAIALSGVSTFREGYVLRFEPARGESWVGNFQPGAGTYCGFLKLHTDRVAVVAGGLGYVIDSNRKVIQHVFGGDVEALLPVEGTSDFLTFGNVGIERHGSTHLAWRTKRIAWDGIRNTRVQSGKLIGEARHFDDSWHSFEVDLASGQHTGGAYEGEA